MYKPKLFAAGLLALLAAASARAAGWEIGGGYADQIDGEASWLATVAYVTSEQRFPWEFMLGYIDGRTEANPGSRADQGFAALSKRWQPVNHAFVSVGMAANSDDNDVLSGHIQFMSTLGIRFDRFSVSVRHLSNAGITGNNHGETFFLLSVAL